MSSLSFEPRRPTRFSDRERWRPDRANVRGPIGPSRAACKTSRGVRLSVPPCLRADGEPHVASRAASRVPQSDQLGCHGLTIVVRVAHTQDPRHRGATGGDCERRSTVLFTAGVRTALTASYPWYWCRPHLDGLQVTSHSQAGQPVVTKEASQGTLNDFLSPCEPLGPRSLCAGSHDQSPSRSGQGHVEQAT